MYILRGSGEGFDVPRNVTVLQVSLLALLAVALSVCSSLAAVCLFFFQFLFQYVCMFLLFVSMMAGWVDD